MSRTGGTTRWARTRRRLGILLAVLVVAVPIPVGLALAWQVHGALVVPAYLLGIPAWLCLVSGAWALVRRVLPGEEPVRPELPALPALPAEPAAPQPPAITTALRLPAPRVEGSVRTPTP